jgi:hypothetical protein
MKELSMKVKYEAGQEVYALLKKESVHKSLQELYIEKVSIRKVEVSFCINNTYVKFFCVVLPNHSNVYVLEENEIAETIPELLSKHKDDLVEKYYKNLRYKDCQA